MLCRANKLHSNNLTVPNSMHTSVLSAANKAVLNSTRLHCRCVQVSQETHRREETDSVWEAQSTLSLWLAQLVLIPFDLAVVDSTLAQGAR